MSDNDGAGSAPGGRSRSRFEGLPVFPVALGDERGRQIPGHPTEPAGESYRTQGYGFRLGGQTFRLNPTEGEGRASPFAMPLHLVSAWHAHCRPATLAECAAAQRSLAASAGAALIGQGAAFAPDRSWFEAILLLSGLDDERAIGLAAEAGQSALVRWDADHLVVLPTSGTSIVTASATGWTLLVPVTAGCPLREPASLQRCRDYGGPFGSAAIHAAALWAEHRALAESLLGCGRCADRRSGAVSLAEIVLGSRWGGYAWPAE